MGDIINKINWTQVLIWLGGIAIIMFFLRRRLEELLPRLRWGKDGMGFGPPQQGTSAHPDTQETSRQLMQAFDNPLLLRQEGNIREDLQRRKLLDKPAEAIPILIRHLAASQITQMFEVFFRTILLSQIHFLELLNTRPAGIPSQRGEIYFQEAAKQAVQTYTGVDYRGWLSWLFTSELIEEVNGLLRITDVGRQFLGYITNQGLDKYTRPL